MTVVKVRVAVDAGAHLALVDLARRERITVAAACRALLRAQMAAAAQRGVMAVAEHLPAEQPFLLALRTEQSPRRRDALLQQILTVGGWRRQIAALCRKWRSDGVAAEDLQAEGLAGLLEAARRWRPGQGWRSFAFRWIEYRITEGVRLHDAGAVAESQREIRARRKTGAAARSRTWAPLNEQTAADEQVDPGEALDLAALRHHLGALDPQTRAALIEHFTNGGGDPALVAQGMALLRGAMR